MNTKTVLVLAPHPDDEILGVGGTMARLARDGARVHVAVVTRGTPPLYSEEYVQRGRAEAREAHGQIGVTECRYLDLPAAELDQVPHRRLNDAVGAVVRELNPDVLFVPFCGDIHLDHQAVFTSALVASRPNGGAYPRAIFAYETLSETNWNAPYLAPSFVPNHFVDITAHLDAKLRALAAYRSQMRPFPNERSIEAARALAMLRGATVSVDAAEAFVTIRTVE